MHKPLREYEQYAKERRHLRRTSLAERTHCIDFLDFLRSRGLDTLDRLQVDDISRFIKSRSAWKPKTVSRAASHLRQFLEFLFMRDIVPRAFSTALPTIRLAQQATVPSVWDRDLVARLLGAVDRCSLKGKRDCATLLLAARLGLRLGDIRNLTLDDLPWTSRHHRDRAGQDPRTADQCRQSRWLSSRAHWSCPTIHSSLAAAHTELPPLRR